MKFKEIIRNHHVTIGIILSIVISAGLSFFGLLPDEKVLGYLLCADVGLAIEIFFYQSNMNKISRN